MTHLLVIGLVVVAALRDMLPPRTSSIAWAADHRAWATALALAPFALFIIVHAIAANVCTRRLDQGRPRALARFERLTSLLRLLILPLHAAAVLALGWLDTVRALVGDRVGLDEFLALLPALASLAATWAFAAPIERRVRDALLIRRLDAGLHIPPMPRMRTWWWGTVKQQMLFAAAPVLLIMTWAEAVAVVRDGLWARMLAEGWRGPPPPKWTSAAPDWLINRDVIVYGSAALQLAGVLMLLAMLPLALRLLWDTVPLGPGRMRDTLAAMCARHRVRVRDILVWRTHGAMINGAVVGFLPRLRYVVLTDALFESLPAEQVEAVAAHELAHVRHRHIPWLAATLVGASLCFGASISLAARLAGTDPVTEGWGPVLLLVLVLGASILVFGWVSRRFEWQADVFAAQHLTRRFDGDNTDLISEPGAHTMAETLRAVAAINAFPPDRFTFRHGSINTRRRHLRDAVGQPLARADADRASRRTKRTVVALFLLGLAAAAAELLCFST